MKSISASSTVITDIKKHLKTIVELRQSCKLYITDIFGDSWNLYFKQGSLLWAMASNHRFRRTDRIGHMYCPQIDFSKIQLREQEISELREYLLLRVLIERKQIDEKIAIAIIERTALEVLFDCFQSHGRIKQVKSVFETSTNSFGSILRSPLFKQPIVYMDTDDLVTKGENFYASWIKYGLRDYSPNLAPTIEKHDKFRDQMDDNLYEELATLIDGEKSLWDLALIAQQDVLKLTRTLLPSIKNRSLELVFTGDKQLPNFYFSARKNAVNLERLQKDSRREYIQELDLPLVACVDNDPKTCQQLAQVLNPAGYRLISIDQSISALSVLLENQPDLIFLNSTMPITSGYELCKQIRRIEKFKTTPIIILTYKDNVVNQVRAKVAGATDTSCKPLDNNKILSIVEQCCGETILEKTQLIEDSASL